MKPKLLKNSKDTFRMTTTKKHHPCPEAEAKRPPYASNASAAHEQLG